MKNDGRTNTKLRKQWWHTACTTHKRPNFVWKTKWKIKMCTSERMREQTNKKLKRIQKSIFFVMLSSLLSYWFHFNHLTRFTYIHTCRTLTFPFPFPFHTHFDFIRSNRSQFFFLDTEIRFSMGSHFYCHCHFFPLSLLASSDSFSFSTFFFFYS